MVVYDDGCLQRPPPNLDHGILTTKDGTPLIRLRSKKSIMESRFKLPMRTWDDVWKSTAWAKFAPDKLKQTLHRSSRNQGELKDGSSTADGEVVNLGDTDGGVETNRTKSNAKTPKTKSKNAVPAAVQVKKSRFKVVPHVQIDDQPTAIAPVQTKRSSPKPQPSSSSGSSDTDSDRLPAGLPMIESNLNELTMVESELKKLEREHEAKHQLLTPNSDGCSVEKTSSTADDGRKQQQRGDDGSGDGKKDKTTKVSSRAAETHSKRLGWLKAFRRKSSADTSSESATAATVATPAPAQSVKPTKNKHPAANSRSSSSAGGSKQSSPRQQQRHRTSTAARSRQQQQHHHVRTTAVPGGGGATVVPVSHITYLDQPYNIRFKRRRFMYDRVYLIWHLIERVSFIGKV